MIMDPFTVAWPLLLGILFQIGIVLLCGLPFLLLACVVGMWEKRLVWPFEPCDEHEAPPLSDYARQMNRMAAEQGFEHLACTRHGNGKIYKVRYDLWLAPDREVLALVGSGTIAGIPLRTTWLHSRLVDGRALITVDHHSGVTSDLTGQWSYSVLLNADFPELLGKHRARVCTEVTPVKPYAADDLLADHLELRAAQSDQLERMGCATYLDDSAPRIVRSFRLGRKDWAPPKLLELDDERNYLVAFRDGKLIALDAGKPEVLGLELGTGERPAAGP
jgi:hypothetical protein